METTIIMILEFYRENGKGHENYYNYRGYVGVI